MLSSIIQPEWLVIHVVEVTDNPGQPGSGTQRQDHPVQGGCLGEQVEAIWLMHPTEEEQCCQHSTKQICKGSIRVIWAALTSEKHRLGNLLTSWTGSDPTEHQDPWVDPLGH